MKHAASSDRVKVACLHCGEDTRGREKFCCAGCAVVYQGIHEAGLADMYYRLRAVSPATTEDGRGDDSPLRKSTEIDDADFAAAVEKVLEKDTDLMCSATGLHCSACSWLVNQIASSVPGINGSRVNASTGRAAFTVERPGAALELQAKLKKVGIQLSVIDSPTGDHAGKSARRLLVKAGVCWAIAGNVMLLSFALYSGLDQSQPDLFRFFTYAIALLGMVSVAYGGSEFFRKALASIRFAWKERSAMHLHMDVPISAGILIGSGYSLYAILSGSSEIWIDSITVLIAALLTARWLQAQSLNKAHQRVQLPQLPSVVRKVVEGIPTIVPTHSVGAGDLIEVKPDETVPADSILLSGRSSVINAVMTGESMPVAIEPGHAVDAGAINAGPPILLQVNRPPGESKLAELVNWIDSGPEAESLVEESNRLAGIFTIVILSVAAGASGIFLAGSVDNGLSRIVAFLVVSCPCALGMSAPLATAIANKRAASAGVFFKSGNLFSALTKIRTIIFDKTGTLTQGNMVLVHSEGDSNAIALGVALEDGEQHPIARALDDAFGNSTTHLVSDRTSVPGRGIEGIVDGSFVRIGAFRWILGMDTCKNETLRSTADRFMESGLSTVAISVDGTMLAVLGLGDSIRGNARDVVCNLNSENVEMMIVSGDNESATSSVAGQLGIENWKASFDPFEKAEYISAIADDRPVLMVGDGVNDASALKAATIGVGFDGHAASMASADIFVTRPDLSLVQRLPGFARQVVGVIRLNRVVSLTYNFVMGALALLGLITPLIAAVAMPLSSLFVVTSSSQIRPFRTK